jgi:hypothetical protein
MDRGRATGVPGLSRVINEAAPVARAVSSMRDSAQTWIRDMEAFP